MLNSKGEWGQNLPPQLEIEGGPRSRKRKEREDEGERGGGHDPPRPPQPPQPPTGVQHPPEAPAGPSANQEGEGGMKCPPPKSKRRQPPMTVKEMLKKLQEKRTSQSTLESTGDEIGMDPHAPPWGMGTPGGSNPPPHSQDLIGLSQKLQMI